MSDSKAKGPTWYPQGHQDRDRRVDKHATPPSGVPEQTWDEPLTGRIDLTQDEIATRRARRPTPQRIESLEKWRVDADKRHLELAVAFGRMEGKVEGVGDKVDTVVALLSDKGKTERTKITANQKIIATVVGGVIALAIAIVKVFA